MAKEKKSEPSIQHCEVLIDGIAVPFILYAEHRYSSRISIGKSAVHLRYPKGVFDYNKEKTLAWGKAWLSTQFEKKPNLKSRFISKTYQSGQSIQAGGRIFTLMVQNIPGDAVKSGVKNDLITLKIGQDIPQNELTSLIRQVLSRSIARQLMPDVSARVNAINDRYFKKDIQTIRLKYNHSNWGSCSVRQTINLSTRLLLAPQVVMDYVIVHELSHLIEMNHSTKFWKIVEKVMPEYAKCEKWLSKHGASLDF